MVREYRKFADAIANKFKDVSVVIDTNDEHGWKTLIVDVSSSEETTQRDILNYIEDTENKRDILGFGSDHTEIHYILVEDMVLISIE